MCGQLPEEGTQEEQPGVMGQTGRKRKMIAFIWELLTWGPVDSCLEMPRNKWLSRDRGRGWHLGSSREQVRVQSQGFTLGTGRMSAMEPDKGHLEKRRKTK